MSGVAAAASALRALGPVDLRNVWRDPMLRWFALLPLALALLLRWLAPALLARVSAWSGFDLTPATAPMVGAVVLAMAPAITGMVIGFLLLDQRDEGTLAALQVSPLTLAGYLAYRLAVPMAIAFAVTLLVLPIAGVARLGLLPAALAALAAAPLAPLFALFLAAFARNKVQGFALMKASGVVLWPPLVAYFVAMPWQLLFGPFPVYWAARLYWSALEGDAAYALWLAPGLAWQGLLTWLLLRRYARAVQR